MLQDFCSKDSLNGQNFGDLDRDHKEEERLETKMAHILVYRYLPSTISMHKPIQHYQKSTIKSRMSMNLPTKGSVKRKGTKAKLTLKSMKHKASIKPKGETEAYKVDDDSVPSIRGAKVVENLRLAR